MILENSTKTSNQKRPSEKQGRLTLSDSMFKKIREAYETLKDSKKEGKYEKQIGC